MILLFDIDGTLLSCGGAGRRALERAFEQVLGRADALSGVRLAGSTDLQIIEDGLRIAAGPDGLDLAPAPTLLERYLQCLEEELERAEQYRVFAGVRELLTAVSGDPRFVVGLATGNVERGARLKLRRGELDAYFGFGGFGSDAQRRAELVRRAVERGLELAARRGLRLSARDVLVLGDTEKDVEAAREVGVRAVGILAGSHHQEALVASRPAFVAESFASPELWAWLGVSPSDPQRRKT